MIEHPSLAVSARYCQVVNNYKHWMVLISTSYSFFIKLQEQRTMKDVHSAVTAVMAIKDDVLHMIWLGM